MADEVVPRQGLFDHHESEVVEFKEVIEVAKSVGVVCVDHEVCVLADGIVYGLDVFEVGVGLNFHFDFCVMTHETI